MGETKGMIGKIGRSIVALPTRMIVRVSERVMKTRDKLPLVGTTYMNDPTNSKPTNNKDIPTGPRVDNTTPSDTRRNANEVIETR